MRYATPGIIIRAPETGADFRDGAAAGRMKTPQGVALLLLALASCTVNPVAMQEAPEQLDPAPPPMTVAAVDDKIAVTAACMRPPTQLSASASTSAVHLTWRHGSFNEAACLREIRRHREVHWLVANPDATPADLAATDWAGRGQRIGSVWPGNVYEAGDKLFSFRNARLEVGTVQIAGAIHRERCGHTNPALKCTYYKYEIYDLLGEGYQRGVELEYRVGTGGWDNGAILTWTNDDDLPTPEMVIPVTGSTRMEAGDTVHFRARVYLSVRRPEKTGRSPATAPIIMQGDTMIMQNSGNHVMISKQGPRIYQPPTVSSERRVVIPNEENLPSKPRRVRAEFDEAHHPIVHWMSPLHRGGGRMKGYRIQYASERTDDTYVWKTAATVGNTSFWKADYSFDRNTTYWFRVAAETTFGVGEWSDVAEATTPDEEPAGRPGGVSLFEASTNASARSITLRWERPSDDGGSPITRYRITSDTRATVISEDLADTTHYSIPERTTSGTSLTYTGLRWADVFVFKLSACNKYGCSFPAAIEVDFTRPPDPPEPTAVEITNVDTNDEAGTATITWTPSTSVNVRVWSRLIDELRHTPIINQSGDTIGWKPSYLGSAVTNDFTASGTRFTASRLGVEPNTGRMRDVRFDVTPRAAGGVKVSASTLMLDPCNGVAPGERRRGVVCQGGVSTARKPGPVQGLSLSGDVFPVVDTTQTPHDTTGWEGNVTATWLPPPDPGSSDVIAYRVRWQRTGQSWGEGIDIDAGTRSWTTPLITLGVVQVEIEVAAINAAGAGSTTTQSYRLLQSPQDTGNRPSAVRNLRMTHNNLTGAWSASWSPPADNGGAPIRDYSINIYRNSVRASGAVAYTRTTYSSLPETHYLNVVGLNSREETTLEIQVWAINTANEPGSTTYARVVFTDACIERPGQYIGGVLCHGTDPNTPTVTKAPDAPRSLRASNINGSAGTFRLSWSRPSDLGGAPASAIWYHVNVSPSGSIPDPGHVVGSTSATVSGVKHSKVTVEVYASNIKGAGPSATLTVTMPSTVAVGCENTDDITCSSKKSGYRDLELVWRGENYTARTTCTISDQRAWEICEDRLEDWSESYAEHHYTTELRNAGICGTRSKTYTHRDLSHFYEGETIRNITARFTVSVTRPSSYCN